MSNDEQIARFGLREFRQTKREGFRPPGEPTASDAFECVCKQTKSPMVVQPTGGGNVEGTSGTLSSQETNAGPEFESEQALQRLVEAYIGGEINFVRAIW
jgi:hypothetical protein